MLRPSHLNRKDQMNLKRLIWTPAAFVAMLGVLLLAPGEALAQQGVVTGQVVDGRTGSPVASAQVSIVGTQLGTLTDREGNFRIPNAPAGAQQVRATFIGYRTSTQDVQVIAGQTATVNFQLSESAVALDELIVTGTAGRQERRAQAASISTLDVASLTQTAPITSVANILQGRTTGVSITTSSGTAGSTQRIRLRGSASLNLSNEPIVIIDGVVADSRTSQIYGVGGQAGSRLNDINPDDIESIEIVKGPAAATLYGADASAGVIQIRTKRGRAGSGFTQSVTYEYGVTSNTWDIPENWAVCTAALVTQPARTLCFGQEPGTIISDQPLTRNNVFRDGRSNVLSWSGRGGGENHGYYLSFSADEQQGTLPDNQYDRYTARVNFDFTPRDDLRLDASFGVARIDSDFPQNDNNIYGYLGGGLLGSPVTVGLPADGWFAANRQVEAISRIENRNMTVRSTPVFTVNYTPRSWFTNRMNAGIDMTRSEAKSFFPLNTNGWYGTATLNSGQISQARQNRDEITLDYLGSIRAPIGDNWNADLAFGAQLVSLRTDLTNATGQGLTTNAAQSINAAAQTTGGQSYSESRAGGIFSQLDLAFRDRLYLQLGGRLDKNSAFGQEVGSFFNPKVGLSYVVSEEDFFPVALEGLVSTLRLRTVWGTTGRSPGTTASLTTFSSAPFAITSNVVGSGVLPSNPGNTELKPEKGEEIEFGFDAGLFNERVGLEVTYYTKTSKDLILERPIAPSLGFGLDPVVNIGELQNRGWEVGLNARMLEARNFTWDARVNLSTNTNEVTDLGDVDPFGTTLRVLEGFPANGWWTHKVRSFDVANNRVIVSDTVEFVGNSNPGFEGNFNSTFNLFNAFRVYVQFDWAQDYILYNNTDQFRERQFGTGERWVNRADLEVEDRLNRFGPFVTDEGRNLLASAVNNAYYQPGDHVRFREASVSYTLPRDVAQRFRASNAVVTLAGRNLALWTDYEGEDPEVLGAITSFSRNDFLTLPQPRRWSVRVNLNF
jgi:TonB-dependent starch-binding outer membrane protein SusC